MKTLHSIYEYFKDYSKEQIDGALEKLTEEEIKIIKLRYGEDLEHPIRTIISDDVKNKFYGRIIPKLKSLLGNPNYRKRKNKKTNKTEEQPQKQPESKKQDEIEKNDCIKMLKILKTPSFSQMTNTLTIKEAIIIALKLGYIDEKYFTTESIAQFLEIDEEEVRETTKKVLLLYRDNINNFLDEIIETANNDNELKLK